MKMIRTLCRTTAALLMFFSATPLFAQADNALSFFVIGDWGTGGKGARRVATAMSDEFARKPVAAVISTGDNIYPSGVSSVDDPQWQSKFEKIFSTEKLPVPFWAVLGNHDCRKNPDAQVAYSEKVLANGRRARWRMPAKNWTTVVEEPASEMTVRLVGIDTQQIVGSKSQRKVVLAWLDSVLTATRETHCLVVGHHPVYSHGHYGNNRTMQRHVAPMLERHGVLAYLNGHEHDLQLIKPINGVRYVISGGGGGKRKTKPGKNTEYCASSLGFFRLTIRPATMDISMIDDHGKVLYSCTDRIQK